MLLEFCQCPGSMVYTTCYISHILYLWQIYIFIYCIMVFALLDFIVGFVLSLEKQIQHATWLPERKTYAFIPGNVFNVDFS